MFPKFLHKFKCFSVDDCRVGIVEYLPFFLRFLNLLFILERLCGSTEVYCISAVFLLRKDVRNS